jgi:hypothetical protein
MSPKRLTTRRVEKSWGQGRSRVAQKYYEVAGLVASEGDEAINVCIGLCVLAGIAAGDAICVAAIGEHYAGQDHTAAADLLSQVDAEAGKHLHKLVRLKPGAHYGDSLLSAKDRTAALLSTKKLMTKAQERYT